MDDAGAGGDRRRGLSRRELLAAGAAAGAALAADGAMSAALAAPSARELIRTEFGGQADGPGWGRAWRCTGVANLRRAGGVGLLEAGSDVFPNDPRPVAFAVDRRALETEVEAAIALVGAAPGVVVRRISPTAYYAAIYSTERGALELFVRDGAVLHELAAIPVSAARAPLTLSLSAEGADPTQLRAVLADADGTTFIATATDASTQLQRPGDAGVLATAQTLFPSDPNPVLPALGNLHLLPWGVQEGQALMQTELGETVVDEIRRRSTAGFARIVVRSPERARRSRPSVIAATTGVPVAGGARLHAASDLAATASFELSYSRRFRDSWTVPAGRTDRFHAATRTVRGLDRDRRVHWRPRLERHGKTVTGPARSFRTMPADRAASPVRIAVAACASQFGPIFDHLAELGADVFVWQGDLNYPDTHGPLAQTTSGYAGIWRDFLANPRLAPVLERTALAAQRDDHDYGVQDANATNIDRYPWVLAPWESLMERRSFYRFRAGAAEVWVLDQRRYKSDPALSDDAAKTLLGLRQRKWLLRTLAASRARFKIICSPTTVFMPANARDGNWAVGYEAERELVLDHVRSRTSGTTIFLTGDTHLTGVYDADGDFEARAAPVGIPKPNDITLVDPTAAETLRRRRGVAYAGDENHLTMLEVSATSLELTLVREDGATPYSKRF